MSRAEKGQSISEYTLLLGLIAIASMAALALFGGNLTSALGIVANGNGNMGGLIGDAQLTGPWGPAARNYDETYLGDLAAAALIQAGYDSGSPNTSPMNQYGDQTICGTQTGASAVIRCQKLMNELILTAQDLDALETAGGLGSDINTLAADMLQQLADQLRAEGEDPGVIALIEQLAQDGYTIAGGLQDIEGFATDPPTIAPNQSAQQFQTWQVGQRDSMASANNTNRTQFESTLGDVNNMLSNDPALASRVNSTIQDASTRIRDISNTYDVGITGDGSYDATGVMWRTNFQGGYTETRQNADRIQNCAPGTCNTTP